VDAVSSVGCLLFGSAIPVALLAALVRRGTRQLSVADTYGAVSRELGLDVDTRGLSLRGHLADQRIWVGSVMVDHGPRRKQACWGVLDLDRPLGLGLVLRRKGLRDRLRRPKGPRVPLDGDPLDRLVEVFGDDPSRVRAVLTPEVRAVLVPVLERWKDLVVTDQTVRIHLPRPLATPAELRELVAAMRGLAKVLYQARRGLPPPPVLAARRADWASLGDALGLDVEEPWPGVAGTVDGRSVRVTPVRTSDGYATEIRVGFRAHARTGLRLRPQEEPDGYWSVGQDIQCDDPAFDRAFVVKGWDPDLVRTLLAPDVRTQLVGLLRHGRLDLDDLRLHLGPVRAEPGDLVPVVRGLLDTARLLGW
jgi:hypothetical protein